MNLVNVVGSEEQSIVNIIEIALIIFPGAQNVWQFVLEAAILYWMDWHQRVR